MKCAFMVNGRVKMKIAIVGASGQLGFEIAELLEGKVKGPKQIHAAYKDAEVIPIIHGQCDIADEDSVAKTFDGAGFDLIINCAAMTDVDACETQKDRAQAANVDGPKNLACAAARSGAKFVHVSTDYVFSGTAHELYNEDDATQPLTEYGLSKLRGEIAVAENCAKHFIVRTAWLYGRRGKNFVRTILFVAKERGAVKVVDDQVGSPTYALDLACAILNLAATDKFGTYHCTNSGTCSWFEFAKEFLEMSGLKDTASPCTTDEFPRPARRPAFSGLSTQKIESALGYKMRPWDEAINDFLKEISKEG